jgi:hypothetical protein
VNVYEMVVVIVVVTSLAKVLSSWLKNRKAVRPADDGRLARLEDRVQVLERIVTDSGYELRRQFTDLERNA